MKVRARFAALWLVLALVAGTEVSCSGNRVRLYPVQGQVLFKGQPLERAMVVLHPVGTYPEDTPKPIAFTDAEGRFKLTTNKAGDGAPAGEYAITVECRERTYTGVEKVGGRNLVPAVYAKKETSGLRFQVTAGENDLPIALAAK